MADENKLVFFDLEATGLDITVCDIIQLSAVCEDRHLNVYCFPQRDLSESAKQITGFTVRGGSLLLRGKPVDTIPLHQALSSFIDFLRSLGKPVVLVAHGARRFDAPVLARALNKCGLRREFERVVVGYIDTFFLCKSLYPYQLRRFSQEHLVRHFLGKSYNAHNALDDARMLQELFKKWNPSKQKQSLHTCRYPLM